MTNKKVTNKKFGIIIFLTFTKLLSLAVLIIGSTYAFIFKNAEVIIFSLALSAGLAGLKNWTDYKGGHNDYNPYNYNQHNNSEKEPDGI